MSKKDKIFLERCMLTVSGLARILEKSRQYISTQINKEKGDDFLNEHYLTRICMNFKESDPEKYKIIIQQIKNIFPQYYNIVRNVVENPILPSSNIECGGEEYWFITGDLRRSLRNTYVVKELESLLEMGCHVTFVTIEKEEKACRFFFYDEKYSNNYISCPVKGIDLESIPTILLKILWDGVQMYGVSEAGFVSLSSAEGERIRNKFKEIISINSRTNRAESI